MSVSDLKQFVWLADAPLFIDGSQVERFYDAVVRLSYVEGPTTVTITESDEGSTTTKVSAEAKGGIGGFLKLLFGASAEVKAGGEVGGSSKTGRAEGRQVQWIPNRTPQRQLEQLILSYHGIVPHRLFMLSPETVAPLLDPQVAADRPPALVVLDLPGQAEAEAKKVPLTKLVPTAAEFEKGVIPLYSQLKKETGEEPPRYPEFAPPRSKRTVGELRKEYWQWFDEHFNPSRAMRVVEEAAADHGRIRWIDFRLPLTTDGDTLHLHVCPAGAFDTGVFAYNLIKRGYKHGLRLVGTLKSEPDMNVLAVYEK